MNGYLFLIIFLAVFLTVFLFVFLFFSFSRLPYTYPSCVCNCPEYPVVYEKKPSNLFIGYDKKYLTLYHDFIYSTEYETYMAQNYIDSTYEIKIKAEKECINQTKLCSKGDYSLRIRIPLPKVSPFLGYSECWNIITSPEKLCDWNSYRTYMRIEMLNASKNNTIYFELVE